jgi:ubiquitin C-terminal hydrolase
MDPLARLEVIDLLHSNDCSPRPAERLHHQKQMGMHSSINNIPDTGIQSQPEGCFINCVILVFVV